MNKKNCNYQQAGNFWGMDFDQLGKTIEDFLGKSNVNEFFGRDAYNKNPLINVYESPEGIDIELAAPGLNREAFSVSIEAQELSVEVNENVNKEAENVKVKRKDFDYSTFKKTFRLSDKYDLEKVTARYENGILYLKIPVRVEEKKASIKVEIL